MIFHETKIKSVFIIEPELIKDERGFFARMWCAKEFANHGLNPNLSQISVAFNSKKHTLRGMHYQQAPHEEAKLVRCTSGSIYDVIIDLRANSKTFKEWFSIELSANSHKMIYVPEGCAHGYITLEDNIEVLYQMSTFYSPNHYVGVRWNDPAFNINWPFCENLIISEKDKSYPDFKIIT